jgi:hypothetical protein
VLPLLLLTYSVFMSQEGVTCCGSSPTSSASTIRMLTGSMTLTVLDMEFGT